MNIIDISDQKIDEELTIHNESIFSLEEDLKMHSRLERKYHKWYAQSIKAVSDLTLELEVIQAEIMDEIRKETSPPPSSWQEIRRSQIPGDLRYRKIKRKLNEATETKDYLYGLTVAWGSRGYRLKELVSLSSRLLWDEPRIKGGKNLNERLDDIGNKMSID